MTMPEKVAAKTATMLSQHSPVATAHGNSLRHATLSPSKNRIATTRSR
jgi:hypothetical protein